MKFSFCSICRRFRSPPRGYARAPAAGMYAFAPEPSVSSGSNAGYGALGFAAWLLIFVCRSFLSSVPPPVGEAALYGLRHIKGHL